MNSSSHVIRTPSCIGRPLLFAMMLHDALFATATNLKLAIHQ
jgi:hypothetical protein